MRRFLASLMAIIFIATSFSAYADENTDIYINKRFESYVTNSTPTDITITGTADTIVKDLGAGNKALYINRRAGTSSNISFPVKNIKGDFVVHYDAMFTGNASNYKVSIANSSLRLTPVNAGDTNAMRTQSGKEYASIGCGQWTGIDIVYHKKLLLYDVYLNGRHVLSDWRMETRGINSVTDIIFAFANTTTDSEIYIDNFRVYSGEKIIPDSYFAKEEYNTRETDYTETVWQMGDTVFNRHEFTNRAEGTPTAKSNLIEHRTEPSGSGNLNGYLHFETYGTDDIILDFGQDAEAPYIVYEASFRYSSIIGAIQLFSMKLAPDNTNCANLRVSSGGGVTLYNGKSVGSITANEWHKFAIAYNFMEKVFDVYIDGKKCISDVPMQITDKEFPSLLRFYGPANAGEFDIDNVFVYEGKEPRSLTTSSDSSGTDVTGYEDIAKTVWGSSEQAQKMLLNTIAFHASSGAMFKDGQKTYPEKSAIIKDKETYLPLRLIADVTGHTVGWDSEKNAAIFDKVAVIKSGERKIPAQNGDIECNAEIINENGNIYIPVEAAEELVGKTVYSNVDGLVIIGGNNEYSEDAEKEISGYMMYERPTAQQIKQDYLNNGKANAHPRVMATQEDFDRIKELIKTDANAKAMYDQIINQADKLMPQELQYYHLPDGVRLLTISENVLQVAEYCSFAYKITGDDKYAQRVWKEVENVALNFPDWHPAHYLDTAEMAMAMAIAYDWCYDYYTQEQREVLLNAIKEKGLLVQLEQYKAKAGWIYSDSNWGFICNGGGIALALAVADEYPEESFALIENAIHSAEYPFGVFVPDGGWPEGPGYWSYGCRYMTYMLATLDNGLGNCYKLDESTGIRDTMNYYIAITGANKAAFSYSDTGSPQTANADYGIWFGHKFNEPAWVKLRTDIARSKCEFSDLLYYYPEEYVKGQNIDLPLDMRFRKTEVAVMRSSYKDNGMLWVAFKGSHMNQSHGHYDNGSFEFDLNGVRWARELGMDSYGLSGYGNIDNDYYRKRAEGHNTLVINPKNGGYQQDPDGEGRIVKFESSESGAFGILDMTEPYAEQANSVKRGFKVDDFRHSLTIRDEMQLREKSNTVYWFMHTGIEDANDIQINGNTAILTDSKTGEQLYFEYITDASKSELKVMDSAPLPSSPNPDGQGVNNGKKLAIVVEGTKNINITVKMYSLDSKLTGEIKPVDNTPLDKWENSNEAMPLKPELTGIYADGKLLDNYDKDTTSYRLEIPFEDDDPEITYDDNPLYDITVQKKDNVVTITARDKTNPLMVSKYTVNIKKIPDIYENLDSFERIYPVAYKASRVPQKENPPQNVGDGDLSTRFAVDGKNEWIELDMGEITDIDCYAIAFYSGKSRDSYYDIQISEDGVNYTTVFSGSTSGITDDYEVFNMPLKFRYFKLVGHGSSVGLWNSPTEIAVLRRK